MDHPRQASHNVLAELSLQGDPLKGPNGTRGGEENRALKILKNKP
jgi:hypothetical protein